MATALYRIIKYGLQNFVRNGWLSTATIAIMLLASTGFGGLIIFGVVTGTAVQSIKDKIDISVYFKADTGEDDILKIQKSLESLPEVKSVEYISKEQALDVFRARHQSDAVISQALQESTANPLEASFNVKAHDPKQYATIASYLNNNQMNQFIDKVSYTQNASVIDKLARITSVLEGGGLALLILLAFVAALVTFNTIRLAIYSNREEISILRLVGASNQFVRGPYVVEGIIYGLFAAVFSMAIIGPVLYWASPYLFQFIPELSIWQYFAGNLWKLFGYQLIFSVGLGVLSSYIAIRKYLKI